MKVSEGSLPYFDKVQSVVVLATPAGTDHGWQIIIGRDPMSGHQNRYSVLEIDCQKGTIRNYAREVSLSLARTLRARRVGELVAGKLGTDPRLVTGWGDFVPFYVDGGYRNG